MLNVCSGRSRLHHVAVATCGTPNSHLSDVWYCTDQGAPPNVNIYYVKAKRPLENRARRYALGRHSFHVHRKRLDVHIGVKAVILLHEKQ